MQSGLADLSLFSVFLGGIFFQSSKVSAGPRPEPVISDQFWNSEWVSAYTQEIFKESHPLVVAFTKGIDENGSYVLGKKGTENEEWQEVIHWMFDNVVTEMYKKKALKMTGRNSTYSCLADLRKPPADSWDKW